MDFLRARFPGCLIVLKGGLNWIFFLRRYLEPKDYNDCNRTMEGVERESNAESFKESRKSKSEKWSVVCDLINFIICLSVVFHPVEDDN